MLLLYFLFAGEVVNIFDSVIIQAGVYIGIYRRLVRVIPCVEVSLAAYAFIVPIVRK